MDPYKVAQREYEWFVREIATPDPLRDAMDLAMLIAKKEAYWNMMVLLEGRDPSVVYWNDWKNREEARYEHNRRITR